MGTGRPVPHSARRCGVKNANCLLQHAVGLGVAYPVRPALAAFERYHPMEGDLAAFELEKGQSTEAAALARLPAYI
jgi:hypothetical protein